MKFLYCKFLIFCMVLSDQRTPYSIMYVWAAFEAKSPPTRQDLVTLINNYTLYIGLISYLSEPIDTPLLSSSLSSSIFDVRFDSESLGIPLS